MAAGCRPQPRPRPRRAGGGRLGLAAHPGPGHPWPATLPRSHCGRRAITPLTYARVPGGGRRAGRMDGPHTAGPGGSDPPAQAGQPRVPVRVPQRRRGTRALLHDASSGLGRRRSARRMADTGVTTAGVASPAERETAVLQRGEGVRGPQELRVLLIRLLSVIGSRRPAEGWPRSGSGSGGGEVGWPRAGGRAPGPGWRGRN